MARAARISRIGAIVGVVVLLVAAAAGAMAYDYTRDVAQSFDDPVKQFEYGSTGGDRLAGIPVGIFKALPEICRKYLPGEGLQSLGFIYEPGMDRPVGTSMRHSLGFDRISLNCAACITCQGLKLSSRAQLVRKVMNPPT